MGRVAPAETENPNSHLNGTSVFADAALLAAGVAEPVAVVGVQLATASAAAPLRSDLRSILIVRLPPPSRAASGRLSTRDSAPPRPCLLYTSPSPRDS